MNKLYDYCNGTLYGVILPDGVSLEAVSQIDYFSEMAGGNRKVNIFADGKEFDSEAEIIAIDVDERKVNENVSLFSDNNGATFIVDFANNSLFNKNAYTTKTGEVLVEDEDSWDYFLNLKTLKTVGAKVKIMIQTDNLLIVQLEDSKFAFASTNKETGDVALSEKAVINGVEYGPIDNCGYINGSVYFQQGDKMVVFEDGIQYVETKEELPRSNKLQKQLRKQKEKEIRKNFIAKYSDLDSAVIPEFKLEEVKLEPKIGNVRRIANNKEYAFTNKDAYKEYAAFEKITDVKLEEMPIVVQMVKNIDDRLLVDPVFVNAIKTWLEKYLRESANLLRNKKEKAHLMRRTPLRRALKSIDNRVEKALRAQEFESGELKTLRQRAGKRLNLITTKASDLIEKKYNNFKKNRTNKQAAKAKQNNRAIEERNKKIAKELDEIAEEVKN